MAARSGASKSRAAKRPKRVVQPKRHSVRSATKTTQSRGTKSTVKGPRKKATPPRNRPPEKSAGTASSNRAASDKSGSRASTKARRRLDSAKKKAAGTKPAARKAAKKPAKTIAAKKTAPIDSLLAEDDRHPVKPEETVSAPAATGSSRQPNLLPAAWPFPMGNRS